MKIRLYLDEDAMDSDLVHALRMHGVDVTTALDEGLIEHYDNDHLAFAASQSRALYSFNAGDYLALHSAYLTQCRHHSCRTATLQRWRADAPPAQDHQSQISRSHARSS